MPNFLTILTRVLDIDIRAIGYAVRSWQGRVVSGKQFIKKDSDRVGTTMWCVRVVE